MELIRQCADLDGLAELMLEPLKPEGGL
jgi:hypothetical protein